MGTFFGLLGLVLVWWIMAALNKQHIQDHGVPAPSRKALARIRRTSRQKGISQEDAYNQWIINKQRRMPKAAPPPQVPPPPPPQRLSTTEESPPYVGPQGTDRIGRVGLVLIGMTVVVMIALAKPWSSKAPSAPPPLQTVAEAPASPPTIRPVVLMPPPSVADIPKLTTPPAPKPKPVEIRRVSEPVAPPPPIVRVAEPKLRTVYRRRGRGGCGSRGGPGYRLANGRCASWRR